jgi:hypothetical protein
VAVSLYEVVKPLEFLGKYHRTLECEVTSLISCVPSYKPVFHLAESDTPIDSIYAAANKRVGGRDIQFMYKEILQLLRFSSSM